MVIVYITYIPLGVRMLCNESIECKRIAGTAPLGREIDDIMRLLFG